MNKKMANTSEPVSAQGKDMIHTLLLALGFSKGLLGDRWTRSFPVVQSELEVDCDAGAFRYEKIGITVTSATTANFSQAENFVVFECVCRLLEKGYKPKDIELEPEWKLGHSDKGGRADIWVRTVDKGGRKHSLLIIECKTAGREFNGAWRDTCGDGAQLFSYFQQERETKFLCLYASSVAGGAIKSEYRLIRVEDNADYLKTLPKSQQGGYKAAKNNKELFAVWRDAYQLDAATVGLFESGIDAYHPGKNKYSAEDLRELDHESMQGKYHEFATILRQHNVSGHENAFDKLVNLFLAKLVDERRNAGDLRFHWKGIAYDNAYDLQDRLQRLYTTGMMEFLGETVTYIDEQDVRRAFRRFERDPDATKDAILDYFRQLKFYTNNDFAFLDVHNERLFEANFAILLKIVRMLEDIRLLTDKPNQFLGDLFEGFLDRGVKQSEGQFFTPLPIVRFIVSSLPLRELVRRLPDPPRVVDYACGAGHFLNEYARQTGPFVSECARKSVREHFGAIVGIEKEYRLSKVAKVAAFMYGEDEMRIVHADALARRPDVPEGTFDLLVANPPYSVRGFLATLSEGDRARYELASSVPSSSFEGFNGIETFFVERAAQLLKPCGIAAVILPSSILSNGASAYVRCRDILLRSFDIVAIAEFGSGTFGKTGTNTVTLFLRKKDAPPNFAVHCANRADAWLAANHRGDEVFQDALVLDRYCAKRGFDPVAYRAFLAADTPERMPAAILESEAFRPLRTHFAKRTAREKWTAGQRAAAERAFLRDEERERLRVFLLADANPVPVLLVKMPSDTKDAKAFLGYEWSTRKGNEGIKYLGSGGLSSTADGDEDDALARNRGIEAIRTPLFDNADLADDEAEKLNALVRKNFLGTLSSIPECLRPFALTVPLVDLLDFDAATFDRQIRTGVSATTAPVQSKFPLVRLGDVAEYATERIPYEAIAVESYVSTDNMLPLCAGIAPYEGKPNLDSVIRYKTGDILVSNIRPYLKKTWLADQDGGCSPDVLVFCVKDTSQTIPAFVAELLKQDSFFDFMMAGKKGMKMPRGDKNAILSFPFPLPPLGVQQQVVEACAAVDADCVKAEDDVKRGKAKIATIMAGVEGPKHSLHSLLIKVSGNLTKVPEKSIRKSGAIPVVTQERSHLIAGYTDTDAPITDVPLVLFGDHSCAIKYIDFPFVRGADGTQLLKTNPEKLIPRFLCEFLKTVELDRVGKYERHFKYLKGVLVPTPPLSEQEKIVAAVETEEAVISAAREVLAGSAARKRAILSEFGILQE